MQISSLSYDVFPDDDGMLGLELYSTGLFISGGIYLLAGFWTEFVALGELPDESNEEHFASGNSW